MTKENSPILGRYRITEMPELDAEYADEETKAFIRLDPDGRGEFHFGYVQGFLDHRVCLRDGQPAAEWSWDGNDELDPAMGRGWAVLEDNGTLAGVIFFHQGDEYSFRANRWPDEKAKKKTRTSPSRTGKHGKAKRLK
jgi:hypothetical protein